MPNNWKGEIRRYDQTSFFWTIYVEEFLMIRGYLNNCPEINIQEAIQKVEKYLNTILINPKHIDWKTE